MKELLYKDRRQEGETPLAQVQLIAYHLLLVLDKVCKDIGLTYWLAYGSLLGAIRHNGFIPWDDDVDVFMTISDYERLRKIASDVFPKDVIWQDPIKDPRISGYYLARIRDAYSTYLTNCGKQRFTEDPNGVWLDIFLLDEFHGRWGLELLHNLKMKNDFRYRLVEQLGPVTLRNLLRIWYGKAWMFVIRLLIWIRKRFCFGESYYVVEGMSDSGVYVMPKKWFGEASHRFVADLFSIPKNYDAVLKCEFGDNFMTPMRTKVEPGINEYGGPVFLSMQTIAHDRSMCYDTVIMNLKKGSIDD